MNIKTKQQYFFKKPTAPKTCFSDVNIAICGKHEAGPGFRDLLRQNLLYSIGLSARSCRYLAYKIREIRGKQLYGDCKQDYSEELACEVYTALTKQPYKERCST